METKHTNRKPLSRYLGYEIDELGNIWSAHGWRGIKEKRLKPHPNNYGYMRVNLKATGKRVTEFVHNLMTEEFIGNKNGLQVRHLDGDKSNNSLSNLKLGSALENANDRELHGRTQRGELHSELICLRKENYRLKKLAAAAPELLEALQDFVIDFEKYYPTLAGSGADKKYEAAKAAIQKATL